MCSLTLGLELSLSTSTSPICSARTAVRMGTASGSRRTESTVRLTLAPSLAAAAKAVSFRHVRVPGAPERRRGDRCGVFRSGAEFGFFRAGARTDNRKSNTKCKWDRTPTSSPDDVAEGQARAHRRRWQNLCTTCSKPAAGSSRQWVFHTCEFPSCQQPKSSSPQHCSQHRALHTRLVDANPTSTGPTYFDPEHDGVVNEPESQCAYSGANGHCKREPKNGVYCSAHTCPIAGCSKPTPSASGTFPEHDHVHDASEFMAFGFAHDQLSQDSSEYTTRVGQVRRGAHQCLSRQPRFPGLAQ